MALSLSSDTFSSSSSSSSWLSISVFRPHPSFSTDDLVSRLSSISKSLHRTAFVKSAVLKSLSNHSSALVAVYSVWDKATVPLAPDNSFPEVNVYEKAVSFVAQTVDAQWFEIDCWDCKDKRSYPQLLQGDIVHLRGIVGEAEYSDLLSYSCLAILKAYFHGVQGLSSCTFFKSLHGPRMTGLGVWQNVDAAYEFFSTPDGTPGERYWRSLGAKLQFGIYEIVFVIAD